MLNKVILVGRLTRDPELRYTPSGHPVSTFTLAVDRPFTDQNGERHADFINIVAWRKLAELATQYLSKGRLVAVDGRLQIRSYETNDGKKRKVAEVIANSIRFLPDGRNGNGNGKASSAGATAATEEEVQAEEVDDLLF